MNPETIARIVSDIADDEAQRRGLTDSAVALAQLEAQGAFEPNCAAARDARAQELYPRDAKLRHVFIAAWDACEEAP